SSGGLAAHAPGSGKAAILRVKLPHVDGWVEGRRANADRYRRLFRDAGLDQTVGLPAVVTGRGHTFNQFVIRAPRRAELRAFLAARGIGLERTAVGDRYVVERMREGDFNLGGEQSGHIVMTDYVTTGDGLVAALQVLSEMQRSGRGAAETLRQFEPVPQMLRNIRYAPGRDPLAADAVRRAVTAAEARLGSAGRLLIRRSGTEPLIRVMAECADEGLLAEVVGGLAETIAAEAG
ncbi:MAG: DegT/DnrJ/EryC1/StrS family aminotransferase, partial [Gemmobacter sp.]